MTRCCSDAYQANERRGILTTPYRVGCICNLVKGGSMRGGDRRRGGVRGGKGVKSRLL